MDKLKQMDLKNMKTWISYLLLFVALQISGCSTNSVLETGVTLGTETIEASQRRNERSNRDSGDVEIRTEDVINGAIKTVLKE